MKPTILLVADDDCLCQALAASLKNEGCETIAACDLISALSLYETFRPELVILDGDLPGLEGSDACRQLRLRYEADQTPILMIIDTPSTYTRAMEAEVTDIVFRHLDLELICFRVRCLLRLNSTIRQTRDSEARLAATLRLAQLASWKWTPMDGSFALSEHAARIFRMETIPRNYSYHDFLAAIYAPDRPPVDSALKMAVQQRKSICIEFRIKRPNGTLGHVTLHGEPSPGAAAATFPALHGILHDTTERRHSEARHQFLQDAIDTLPVGITVTDMQGRIVYANPAEAEMHGLSVTELLALKARQLAPPRLHEEIVADKLRTVRVWRRESVNIRNGEEFPVQLTSVGLFDSQGMPRGLATVSEDISGRKDAENRIERLAYYDPLTGLPNRLLFFDRLHQALTTASRKGHRTGILFLDLDNFKDVNDTQGHDFGDKFLREVARRLSSGMREADTLARLGGDEFVVVLTTLGETDSAAVAAQRFLNLLAGPLEVDGRQVYTSASIGVALYPDDAVDSEGLLKCADSAMYQAKSEGKQNYRFFSAMLNESLVRRVELENALRQGFKEEEFSLHYQPIWDAQAGRMVGIEAFVRWHNPRFGHLLPTEFIPLAEKTGTIFDIGEWILRTACRQAKQWQAAGNDEFRIAVNVSARQFHHPDFPEQLSRIMEETDFHPRWLELDFTESILQQQADRTVATLEALKQKGISIAIDDFGSGGSSLSCLQDMPIDRLKIDRPLIANITGPREDRRVLAAILSLAQGLGMRVVAEGVETGEQFRLLTLQGCDELQGYYLGCPMSVEEFSGWLAGNGGMWLPPSREREGWER